MQLASNNGRVVKLSAEQAAEFQQLAATTCAAHARHLAFSGQLPTQLGPEGLAARQHAKEDQIAALRQQRREAANAYLRFAAARQALLHVFPELHLSLQKRIVGRSYRFFAVSRYSFVLPMPVPPEWNDLNERQQATAMIDARQMLAQLNANDWRRVREKMSDGYFERMLDFAGPEVLAGLL